MLFQEALRQRRRRIIVLRDTKEDCRDKVEKEFIRWYNDPQARLKQYKDGEITVEQLDKYLHQESFTHIITENKTKHIHTIKEIKSTIEFSGADEQDSIIGLTPDILWINEPYLFDEGVFKEIEQRTNNYTIIDWNPRFEHWVDKLKLRDDCIMLHSTPFDNPFIEPKVLDGLLRTQPLSNDYIETDFNVKPLLQLDNVEDVKQQIEDLPQTEQKEIIRCWNNEKQKTSDKYRYEVYVLGKKAEKPDKIYKGWESCSKEFFDSIKAPVYYGLDLGITAPTACVAVKYVERSLFVHEILYLPGEEIDSLPWALEKRGVDKKRPVVTDRRVRGTSQRDALSLNELHNSGFVYAIPAIKPKGSVISGIEFIQKCKVYVTNISKNVWAEYYEYEYAKYNGQIIDEPLRKNDHAMDAVRMPMNYMRIELGITI